MIEKGIAKGIEQSKINETKTKGNGLYVFGFLFVVFFIGTTAKPIFVKYLGIDPSTQYITFWSTFITYQLMSFLEALSSSKKECLAKSFIKILPLSIVGALIFAFTLEAIFG